MGYVNQQEPDLARLRELVRKIVDTETCDFAERAAHARGVRAAVQAALVPILEPALNKQLNSMPQDTLEEKRSLASWVNHELHELGLAIRCPLTGRQAVLVANPGRCGDEGEKSRFRIESRDDQGRKRHSPTSGWVPEITLVVYGGRKEGRAHGRD